MHHFRDFRVIASAPIIMDHLKIASDLNDDPVIFHYDTTFNMGDYWVSPLIFRNSVMDGDPLIPLAFLIHTRKRQKDHREFFEHVVQRCPTLKYSADM